MVPEVTDYLKLARSLSQRELQRPRLAYSMLTKAIREGDASLPLSDRDLVAAASYANDRNEPNTVSVALNELALRLAADEPVESLERAA